MNNKVIVCGSGTNGCYLMSCSSVTFIKSKLQSRSYAAGIVVNDMLWLTGGYSSSCLQSTEYISGIILLKFIEIFGDFINSPKFKILTYSEV